MANYHVLKNHTTLERWILLFAPSIFVFLVILFPFLDLASGKINAGFITQVFSNSPVSLVTRRAIWNSTLQGAFSALLSFAVGLPLGMFLGRFSFRFKKAVTSLILVPFFLPSVVVVLAFVSSFGPDSFLHAVIPFSAVLASGFTGIIAVNTFFNAPLVALFTMTAIEQVDLSLDEAAITLNASDARRFFTVWGRDGIASGLGGALLAFVYSFSGFAAPLIIGGSQNYTMDAWIYFFYRTVYNLPAAVFLAIIEAIVLMVPAVAYVMFFTRKPRVAGGGPLVRSPRTARNIFFLIGLAYAALWIGIEAYILSSVLAMSLFNGGTHWTGLGNYYVLFGSRADYAVGIGAWNSILNTLFYGSLTALLVTGLGSMWIVGKRRLAVTGAPVADLMQYVPLVISAIVMAFSLLVVYGSVTPVYLLWVLIVAAQSAVAIPVVLRILEAGFSPIPRSHTEAAMVLKGNAFFEVELPMAKSTFGSALMFGFAISLGEFSATNFLASGTFIPLTVEIYLLQYDRLFGAAYAAAAILLIVSLISFYVIQLLGERFSAFR